MAERVLVCRIAWMDLYSGVTEADPPSGGGVYVETMGFGHEAFNFAPYKGVYYGYVQPMGSGVNLENLGAPPGATRQEGVTVIWVAKHPEGRQRIVGWYRDAVAFAEQQDSPTSTRRLPNGDVAGYLVRSRKAFLLDRDERTFTVQKGKGYMGQAQLWYPEARKAAALLKYITAFEAPESSKKRSSRSSTRLLDTERRLKIERTAMEVASQWFSSQGFNVKDVSAQRVGWDLEARWGDEYLRLEVKGTSLQLSSVGVEMTPQEYMQMIDPGGRKSYRICIVTNAERTPDLYIFAWSPEASSWTARKGQCRLAVEEYTGATLSFSRGQ